MTSNLQYVAEIQLGDAHPARFTADTQAEAEANAQEEINLIDLMWQELRPAYSLTVRAVCSDCSGNGRRHSQRPNDYRTILCPSCKGKNSETILKTVQVQASDSR